MQSQSDYQLDPVTTPCCGYIINIGNTCRIIHNRAVCVCMRVHPKTCSVVYTVLYTVSCVLVCTAHVRYGEESSGFYVRTYVRVACFQS